jgi:hypothetical protein
MKVRTFQWLSSLEIAKEEAQKEGKLILVDFFTPG